MKTFGSKSFEAPGGKKERRPMPKLEMHLSLGMHGTSEQLEGLEEDIRRADIYVPEAVAHDEELREMYQAVADGAVSPDELVRKHGFPADSPDFFRLKAMHGSGVKIFFADLPVEHPLIAKRLRLDEQYSRAHEKFGRGEFDRAMNEMRTVAGGEANDLREREAYMRQRIDRELPRVIQADDALAGRESLRVVMDLVIAHTDVYRELRKKYPTTRTLRGSIHVFSPLDEAVRRKFGKKEVPDELLAREFIVAPLIEHCLPTDKVVEFGAAQMIARAIASKLSLKQIEEISKGFAADQDSGAVFDRKMKEFGVEIPRTREEADRMLERILGKGSKRFEEHELGPKDGT